MSSLVLIVGVKIKCDIPICDQNLNGDHPFCIPHDYNKVRHQFITLHKITMQFISLHYILVHYIILHCSSLHNIALQFISIHYIAVHYITLYCGSLHYITLQFITFLFITLHYNSLHSKCWKFFSKRSKRGKCFINESFLKVFLFKFASKFP